MKTICMTADQNFDSDLLALAALSDDDIDSSDISETLSFDGAVVGRYSDIEVRRYDVRSIANWVLRTAALHHVKVTNLWINKFVYFIVENSLRMRKVLITPARIEAWEFGPVFRELYFNFPQGEAGYYRRFNVVKRQKEVAIDPFDAEDVELFKAVWRDYGNLTASQLTRLSHKPGSPWHTVWQNGGKINPGMVIDISTILGRYADHTYGND